MASKASALSILERLLAFPIESTSCRFVLFALFVQFFLYDAINEVFPSTPPLDHLTKSFNPDLQQPPAKRLVIFIGDGLRSQSMYSDDMLATPHLRDIAKKRGVCGVSHASVPTESRSGHVAMLAGIREDLHSVTSNWKEEAVHFDHVFNRSTHTFAWGSPGVLLLFPVKGKVQAVSHHHDRENFAGDDAKTLLDEMFNNFTATFTRLPANVKQRMKEENGLVVFLHMISTDLGGHALKPYTRPYRELMRLIDNTVAKVEKFLEEYFNNDGRTAYLFTADHGMTDWGAHGGGHVTETLTPVIAWGAGVSGPLAKLTNLQQIDLCPLMSGILGLPVPTNNRGRLLPNMLKLTSKDAAILMQANVRQLLQVFELTKQKTRKASMFLFFKDFDKLTMESANKRLMLAEKALKSEDANLAMVELESLAVDIQAGLNFFAKRERLFHWFCLCAAFIIWILCLAVDALPPAAKTVPLAPWKAGLGLFILGSQAIILLFERRPFTHWLLRLGPLFLLWALIRQRHRLWGMPRSLKELAYALASCFGTLFLINSFYWRQVICLAFLTHVGWVFASVPNRRSKAAIAFFASAIVLGIAPLLPEVGVNTELTLVPLGALCQCVFFVYMLAKARFSKVQQFACLVQLVLLACGLVTHRMAHEVILQGGRLPPTLQAINWSILITAFAIGILLCWSTSIGVALYHVSLSIFVVYALLSLSYEGFILLALFINLSAWVSMEGKEENDFACWAEVFIVKPPESISGHNLFRHGFSLIVMMLVALLGAGHTASVSSYDPNSIFTLYTIFRPSIVIPLAFLKVLLPLFLTAHVFVVLTVRRPLAQVLKSALFFANILCFDFLCFVKDNRSGVTAVGTSVGHYVIAMVLSMLLVVFLSAAKFVFRLTGDLVEVRPQSSKGTPGV